MIVEVGFEDSQDYRYDEGLIALSLGLLDQLIRQLAKHGASSR